jgi:hypothetical protein
MKDNKHIKSFGEFKEKLNISDVMFSESKIYTMEDKELEDILFDISKCNGEKGMEKLVKLQGLGSGMNKSNKIRSKVLKAIKKRLDEIGF